MPRARDRSTDSNHQTSSETKWQITPFLVWVSLYFTFCALSLSLCLPWSLCLSSRFQRALPSLSFLPSGLSSRLSNSPYTAQSIFRFFTLLLSFCTSSLFAHFHIPHLPNSMSPPVHHVLSISVDPAAWQMQRMTYFFLSNTPEVEPARARPWAGISVSVTMWSGRLTLQFGKLTGFTALVQQGQGTERTQRTCIWGQPGREDENILQAWNLSFIDTANNKNTVCFFIIIIVMLSFYLV